MAQKKLLYQTIANKLAINPGMRKEDIFITLVDVPKENWSYGNGEAQFAPHAEPSAPANTTTVPALVNSSTPWILPTALGFSVLSLVLAAIVVARKW